MKSNWRKITDPPTIRPTKHGLWESDRILLWVANGGFDRKGQHAFGKRIGSSKTALLYQAEGYSSSGWEITHWMPLEPKP